MILSAPPHDSALDREQGGRDDYSELGQHLAPVDTEPIRVCTCERKATTRGRRACAPHHASLQLRPPSVTSYNITLRNRNKTTARYHHPVGPSLVSFSPPETWDITLQANHTRDVSNLFPVSSGDCRRQSATTNQDLIHSGSPRRLKPVRHLASPLAGTSTSRFAVKPYTSPHRLRYTHNVLPA